MKTRSDFVSNSSSSSFIVRDDGAVPEIFREERISSDEFFSRYFGQDVADTLAYRLKYRNGVDALRQMEFVSPEEFAAGYLENGSFGAGGRMLALKGDEDLVEKAARLGCVRRGLDQINHTVYVNGRPDGHLTALARRAVLAEQWKVDDEIDDVLAKMTGHLKDALGTSMDGWSFWCAELDDRREPEGYGALAGMKDAWARVFDNH